jgi:hypothetical protein
MKRMRYGLGIDDVVARERRLTRRAIALKTLAATSAAAGFVGPVIALLGTGGGSAALLAASPLVLALVAGPAAVVTDVQLRRVRLLLVVLAEGSAAPRAPAPPSSPATMSAPPAGAPKRARDAALPPPSASVGRWAASGRRAPTTGERGLSAEGGR